MPRRNFLFRTVGFFEDPGIGIVQTPQFFFNPDPIQYNLNLHRHWVDEQRLTFEDMQPCRDAWDVAYCCGSCSLYRRSALNEVGGFPTESVTEDVLSTLVLLRAGYRTRYLNEKLTHGLAPESVEAFFVQRGRWCRGSLQILMLPAGPLAPGLTWKQHLMFLPHGFDWIVQVLIRLLVLLVPLMLLFFGLRPYQQVSLGTFFAYLFPVWIALKGVMFYLAPGRHFPLITTATTLLTPFYTLPTIISTLIKPFGAPFKVTPKGRANKHTSDRYVLRFAWLLIAIFALAMTMKSLSVFLPA